MAGATTDDRWLSPRVRVGLVVTLSVAAIVGIFDVYLLLDDLEQAAGDILIEAHGVVFDVALFGVLILFLDERREAARRRKKAADEHLEMIRGWHEQLQDFTGWHGEEAAMRTAGLLRRLSRARARIEAPYAYAKGAMLSDVWFIGADLAQANFERALIDRAKLDDADLRFATLGGARLDETSLKRANLFEADLTSSILRSADLSDADLEKANLGGADLSSACLRRARLPRANLAHATLDGADLCGCDLSDADLTGASLAGAHRLVRDPPVRGWRLAEQGGDGENAKGTLIEALATLDPIEPV